VCVCVRVEEGECLKMVVEREKESSRERERGRVSTREGGRERERLCVCIRVDKGECI